MPTDAVIKAEETEVQLTPDEELAAALDVLSDSMEARDEDKEGDADETDETEKETGENSGDEEDKEGTEETEAAKKKEETASTEEDTETPEGEEKDTKGEEESEEKIVKSDPVVTDKLSEMQAILREQQKQNALLTAKLERMEKSTKALQEANKSEFDTDEEKEEELSLIEQSQKDLNSIKNQKALIDEQALDIVRSDPNYPGVDRINTPQRISDIVEGMAIGFAKQNNVSKEVARIKVEAGLWRQPNRHKYLYDMITKYHTDFEEARRLTAEEEEAEKVKLKNEQEEAKNLALKKKRETTPAKAPESIASIGSGSDGKSGAWTAERIESLPEDELDDVPSDIYAAYMDGKLA